MKEHKFKIKLTLLKKIQYLRKYNFTTKEMRISFGSKFVVILTLNIIRSQRVH